MAFKLSMTREAEEQMQSIMDDPSKKGLQKQLKKALGFLRENPKYPALNSHLLVGSEETMGIKVWTSYVQNRTPQAHRILWTYGTKKQEIVILNIIPHY